MPGGVPSRHLHAGEPRIRLRPHAQAHRRDAGGHTRKPERTWKVPKDVRGKSAGAQGVLDPNDPGGVGDRSGVIMLERFAQERWLEGRSRERLVKDAAAWLATNANEEKEGR